MSNANTPDATPPTAPVATRAGRTFADRFIAPTGDDAKRFAEQVLSARPRLIPGNLLDACSDGGGEYGPSHPELRTLIARAYAMGKRDGATEERSRIVEVP